MSDPKVRQLEAEYEGIKNELVEQRKALVEESKENRKLREENKALATELQETKEVLFCKNKLVNDQYNRITELMKNPTMTFKFEDKPKPEPITVERWEKAVKELKDNRLKGGYLAMPYVVPEPTPPQRVEAIYHALVNLPPNRQFNLVESAFKLLNMDLTLRTVNKPLEPTLERSTDNPPKTTPEPTEASSGVPSGPSFKSLVLELLSGYGFNVPLASPDMNIVEGLEAWLGNNIKRVGTTKGVEEHVTRRRFFKVRDRVLNYLMNKMGTRPGIDLNDIRDLFDED